MRPAALEERSEVRDRGYLRQRIRLSVAGSAVAEHCYEIAGRQLVSDLPLEPLRPFAAQPAGAAVAMAPRWRRPSGTGTRLYRGPGWVGGRLAEVECRLHPEGYLLRVAGAADLVVGRDAAAVTVGFPGGVVPTRLELDALLGPGIVLALALAGVWCLHASALATGGGGVALAGDSGAGKSTVAAAAARTSARWRRMADDLLPLAATGAGFEALPRFPQPGVVEQWRPPAPARVPLETIYLLEPGSDEVEVATPTARAAALALVHNTVAARLFDRQLQAAHLDACVEMVAATRVRLLRLPRTRESLAAVVAALAADQPAAERA